MRLFGRFYASDPPPHFLQIRFIFYNSRLAQGFDALANAGSHVVLRHGDVLVAEQLLRVIHAAEHAGFGAGLGPDVAELEIDSGSGARLVESLA